jgi:hypothetical protein
MSIELVPILRDAGDPQITIKGSFIAGGTAVFFFTFVTVSGEMYDPSNIDISITDPDGAVADTGTAADKLETGRYAYSWDIPEDAEPGLYTIYVNYTVKQVGGSSTELLTEAFVVGEAEEEHVTPQVVSFRAFVESLIGYTQRIPVYHEIGQLDSTRTTAKFTFPRWNQPAGAEVFLNGVPKTDGFEVDFLKGRVIFSHVLSSVDEIYVNYNFRWFTDNEIDNFVAQGTEIFNQYPPSSVYTLINLPIRYGITISEQAAVFALRRLIMDLHFQEPAIVFGGMDRADKLMGSLETLKQNMEEEINKLYEMKKYGPYTGLTRTVTAPEFTLPGGRSRWFRYLFKGAMLFFPLMWAFI